MFEPLSDLITALFSSSPLACGLTAAVGLFTASLAKQWSSRWAAFWCVVSSVQLVELAILLTADRCASEPQLALTLHLLLVASVSLQPLFYARYIAEQLGSWFAASLPA